MVSLLNVLLHNSQARATDGGSTVGCQRCGCAGTGCAGGVAVTVAVTHTVTVTLSAGVLRMAQLGYVPPAARVSSNLWQILASHSLLSTVNLMMMLIVMMMRMLLVDHTPRCVLSIRCTLHGKSSFDCRSWSLSTTWMSLLLVVVYPLKCFISSHCLPHRLLTPQRSSWSFWSLAAICNLRRLRIAFSAHRTPAPGILSFMIFSLLFSYC